MWFALAAANDFENATESRDVMAKKLSPSVLAAADRRISELYEQFNQ